MSGSAKSIIDSINNAYIKKNVPEFRTGDSVKVYARIVEGNKERIQVFEGVVIKRNGGKGASATFTVRKVSFNTGVERTFYLHSPRIDRIEVVAKGVVRRARLFYLRDLRGKAASIKKKFLATKKENIAEVLDSTEASQIEDNAAETIKSKKSSKKNTTTEVKASSSNVEGAVVAE